MDGGGAPTRVPKPSRSDQFYVPEFAELTLIVSVVQKDQAFDTRSLGLLVKSRVGVEKGLRGIASWWV